ncbi:MAG TPA: fibronectin type III domain-containing protein [Thermoleophilaceae bacterium]|jgi:hypothetical protein
MTLVRWLALGGTLLLAGLFSGVARADTYCVTPAGGCDGAHTFADVQAALTGVANNGHADTIQLGSATYSQDAMVYSGNDAVTLVGAGTTATTLQRTAAAASTVVLRGSGTGSVFLEHLHVHMLSVSGSLTGVRLDHGGGLDDVVIDINPGSGSPDGAVVTGTTSITNSTIDVHLGGTCISADGSTTTLAGDTLRNCGIALNGQGGAVHAEAMRIANAQIGVDAGGGANVLIEDSLLTFSAPATGVELGASGSGSPTRLTAKHVTIVGVSGGLGAEAFNHATTQPATLELDDAIIRGVSTSLSRDSVAGDPANIVAEYNDYDTSTVIQPGGGPGSITSTHVYDNVDPQFVNAAGGDYHLAPASPLIDQDPRFLAAGESPFDFDGHARIVNGKRDLGAFERTLAPSATTGAVSAITATTATVAGLVNPGGEAAEWNVAFGTTPALTSSTTLSPLVVSAADQPVSTVLTGLTPGTTYHYSVRATNSVGLGVGADRTFTTIAAALSGLKLSPKSFAAARSGASLSKSKKSRTGTKLTYKLSNAATVTFRVRKLVRGVRAGKRCVAKSKKHPRGKRCTRAVLLKGSFARSSKAGTNSAHFSGRLRRHALRPGSYRLTGTPTGGKARSINFKIVKS